MHFSLYPHSINLYPMVMNLLITIFFLLAFLHIYIPESSTTLAQPLSIVDLDGDPIVPDTYIVTVVEPNDAHLLSDEELEEWHRSFLPNTTLSTGEPRLLYSYRYATSGFSAKLTRDELKSIEEMDGFLFAQPDRIRKPQTTYTPDFLKLRTNSEKTWKQGHYGKGVIIGVVDTGILRDHPSFTDNGNMDPPPVKWKGCCHFDKKCEKSACNNKLIGARGPSFFRNATDTAGHGSHCAGTAAGNRVQGANVLGQASGEAAGMAPDAYLATYKACYGEDEESECHDSYILYGMDNAIKDGVDVLSLSWDLPGGNYYGNPVMRASFTAMYTKDIISCACAGNRGQLGPGEVGNDAPWVLTVGASSTDRVVRSVVKLGNGKEYYGEGVFLPTNLPADPIVPLEYPGRYGNNDTMLACMKGAFKYLDVKGKIVMCGFTQSSNANKSEVVLEAGGVGVVILNQDFDMYTTLSEATAIPASNINHLDAKDMLKYFNNNPNPTATIILEGTHFNARQAPAVADFSSRGPSMRNGGIMKPDIIGPGVNILAAWHREVGPLPHLHSNSAFNIERGCSMATPHLAGVAALVRSAHPTWTAAEIKSAIMTTAYTTDREGKPISDEKSPTHEAAGNYDMGAGHVDPERAIDPGLVFDIPKDQYIGYLCYRQYPDTNIWDMAKRKVDCKTETHVTPDQLNYPTFSAHLRKAPSDGLSCTQHTLTRTVKNVGPASSSYSVQVKKPKGVGIKVCPKKLEFKHVNQEKSFSVKLVKCRHHPPARGTHADGHIQWTSEKHNVTCPLTVNF